MFFKIILCIISSIISLNAQSINSLLSAGPKIQHKVSVGAYKPPDIDSGMNLGYGYYRFIDESVSIGFAVDLFKTNYKKMSEVGVADTTGLGQTISTQQVEVDMTSYLFPLMGSVKIGLPIEMGSFLPYSNLSLGWNNLFNNETNYVTQEQKFRFFNGFGWVLGVGARMDLGDKSSVGLETYYRSAKMKANVDETEAGLPVFDELDMTGFGVQVGLFMNM